jgi:hypothetical protein
VEPTQDVKIEPNVEPTQDVKIEPNVEPTQDVEKACKQYCQPIDPSLEKLTRPNLTFHKILPGIVLKKEYCLECKTYPKYKSSYGDWCSICWNKLEKQAKEAIIDKGNFEDVQIEPNVEPDQDVQKACQLPIDPSLEKLTCPNLSFYKISPGIVLKKAYCLECRTYPKYKSYCGDWCLICWDKLTKQVKEAIIVKGNFEEYETPMVTAHEIYNKGKPNEYKVPVKCETVMDAVDEHNSETNVTVLSNEPDAKTTGSCRICGNETFLRRNGKSFNFYCKPCYQNMNFCINNGCQGKLYPANNTNFCRRCLSVDPVKCNSDYCQTKTRNENGRCRDCNYFK